MDKARELNPHSLLTEQILSKLHKNESRFGKRDIVSDLENGVEVTEDNIDEWNDDGQYSVEEYWKMGRGVQTTLNLKHSDSYYSYRDSE